ncbi:MAG: ribosomal-processing cysteine protease Prp [Clostridia bacterium]|nr:ribosomal-processing cysteine protease Prp [Clostridia bacterium]
MTQAEFRCCDGVPVAFVIRGHSGYAESGADIVCAAVSSAAQLVCNTVTEVLGIRADVRADEASATLSLQLPAGCSETAASLLKGLQLHLQELAAQYPRFLKVTTKGK